MSDITALVADNLAIWTGAIERKSGAGRGGSKRISLYGIGLLRALILDLAVLGKLVPQDVGDEPAERQLGRIRKARNALVASGFLRKPKKASKTEVASTLEEFPEGWSLVQIDDLSPFPLADGDWIETKDQDENGQVRLIQLADVGVGEFLNKSRRFINEETESRLNCTRLNIGDILIARLPNPIGRACLFPAIEQPAITAVDVAILRPNEDIRADYVVIAINSPKIRAQIEAYGKGATRFRVSTGHLKTVWLPLPPLAEQRRIVAKVDELMALCDALGRESADAMAAHQALVETLLATLVNSEDAATLAANWMRLESHFDTLFTTDASIDELKQTILDLAVRGRLVKQDAGDEPADKMLVAAKKTFIKGGSKAKLHPPIKPADQPFRLPPSWQWERFDNLIQPEMPIAYGVLVPGDDQAGGIPFVRIADLSITDPPVLPEKAISPEVDAQFERTRIKGGEILMGVVGSIGKLGVAPPSWAGANIARAICRIVPASFMDQAYVLWLLQSRFMQDSFKGDTRTLAQPTLNLTLIRLAATPIPPLAEQRRIVAKVDAVMAVCDALKVSLANAALTQRHLADAITARVAA